ncbi:muramoyltetrapeptide carboxypeptidase [Catenuloplanes nepalensis]|uniref:Muramoyltetrapeptide carboxypeptidase n=1 Tax=Catenuloplanes nepalensis TaxID=587533 RepID=A0ABT9MLQ9_9ACTN|nr:LD-carboxypeptidase [Catenuloplanes nepalensis]MDP9792356.1 muramoyltetrapeptide carboxypeptidase [Catenuloplanes nepalensis]
MITSNSSTVLVRRAPALVPGDVVRIVATAHPGDARLDRGQAVLEQLGLVVQYGEHVYAGTPYLAGTDSQRLADLNAAFRDPAVRAVIGARGGYGTQRIVDGLDLDAVRADPKVFLGFSDLTAMHGRLWRDARLISFYGPVAAWADDRTGPASVASLRDALMSRDAIVLTRDPAEPSAAVRVDGVASGPLLGGNLTMIASDVGTGSLPDFDGAILLFEDVNEAPYRYDRMLTQLIRSGALDRLAGVALGQFTNCAGTPSAAAVVSERLGTLGVPVLGGLRIGHGPGQLTVPIGAHATIDVEAGTLTVEAGVR